MEPEPQRTQQKGAGCPKKPSTLLQESDECLVHETWSDGALRGHLSAHTASGQPWQYPAVAKMQPHPGLRHRSAQEPAWERVRAERLQHCSGCTSRRPPFCLAGPQPPAPAAQLHAQQPQIGVLWHTTCWPYFACTCSSLPAPRAQVQDKPHVMLYCGDRPLLAAVHRLCHADQAQSVRSSICCMPCPGTQAAEAPHLDCCPA